MDSLLTLTNITNREAKDGVHVGGDGDDVACQCIVDGLMIREGGYEVA